jgi:hypothetical protein
MRLRAGVANRHRAFLAQHAIRPDRQRRASEPAAGMNDNARRDAFRIHVHRDKDRLRRDEFHAAFRQRRYL